MSKDSDEISVEIGKDYCVICLLRFKSPTKSQHDMDTLMKFSFSDTEYIHVCKDCWEAIRKSGQFKPDKGARFNNTISIDSILKTRGKLKSFMIPSKPS